MRKLGLIGGTGPESTVPYYRGIVFAVQRETGNFPPLTIESVSVFDVLRLCGAGEYEKLTGYLLEAVRNLAGAGAEVAALTGNTPHIVFDRLQALSPIPLVSMVEATCRETARRGLDRVGLLGTIFTMEEEFFRVPFREQGIQVAVPTRAEREYLNRVIADELELGTVREESRARVLAMVERMAREDGIQAVILGCTELPMLLSDRNSPVPCLDTMEIHINTLVGEILREN